MSPHYTLTEIATLLGRDKPTVRGWAHTWKTTNAQAINAGQPPSCPVAIPGNNPRRSGLYDWNQVQAWWATQQAKHGPTLPDLPDDTELTRSEIAAILGVSEATVSNQASNGRLPKSIRRGVWRYGDVREAVERAPGQSWRAHQTKH